LWGLITAQANGEKQEKCRELWKKAHELVLIFSAIIKKKWSVYLKFIH